MKKRTGFRAKLWRAVSRADRKLFGSSSQRGALSWAMIIAFLVALLLAFGGAIVEGFKWIFQNVLIPGINFAPLMVHIPGIAKQPFFNETVRASPLVPADLPSVFAVSNAMGEIYGSFQLIALVGFIVALIIIGITYVSEQFSFVSRGTAFQLLSESGLVLILLFLFPLIFNGAAAILNGLNQEVILKVPGKTAGEVIKKVADASATFGVTGFTHWIPGVNLVDMIFMIMQATATFAALFSLFVTGVMRLVFIGILAGAFPLILIFRLIPPLRGIAVQLQGALVGLLVGTILIAIMFRVSYGIIDKGELNQIMTWVIGVGSLLTASFLMFAFASGFGGIGKMIQRGITGPTAGVMGGTIAMAGGLATGGLLGAAPAIGSTVIGGIGTSGMKGALSEIGRSALSGAVAGAKAGSPIGAVFAAPVRARETALGVEAKRLVESTQHLEGTPPYGTFLEDFSSPRHLNARAEIRRSALHEDQERKAGEIIARELNEGRFSDDLIQRMYTEAKFHPKNKWQFNHHLNVVKRSELKRPQLESALKAAYANLKSDPAVGEAEADLWLRSIYNRATGRPAFNRLGEGMVFGSPIEGIEGGG
ncbi:MAG: hypothetical protein QW835_03470 [Candidatus Hadarchaeum sp.]